MMVPETPLEQTEYGLVAAGAGWFVLNVREAAWFDLRGRGFSAGLECRGHFDQIGISLRVLESGEPMAMYHWETDQEDFVVLSGEALLIAEGEERLLRRWDFVHCPAETKHVCVEEETTDADVAYARFPEREPTRYRDGWLPG